MKLLSECWLIALDVFKENLYTENVEVNRKNGWLTLFASRTAQEAEEAVIRYPWLEEIYQEMASYRERPEEVFGMYSAVLKEFDDNTVKYMIEEQQKEIDEQQKEIVEQQKEIEEQQKEIVEQQKVIKQTKEELNQKDKIIAELQAQLLRQNK